MRGGNNWEMRTYLRMRRAAAAAALAAGRQRHRPAGQDLPGAGHAQQPKLAARGAAAALRRIQRHAGAAAARHLPPGARWPPLSLPVQSSLLLLCRAEQPTSSLPGRAAYFLSAGQSSLLPLCRAEQQMLHPEHLGLPAVCVSAACLHACMHACGDAGGTGTHVLLDSRLQWCGPRLQLLLT
jgi:hypothetical protein